MAEAVRAMCQAPGVGEQERLCAQKSLALQWMTTFPWKAGFVVTRTLAADPWEGPRSRRGRGLLS